MGSLPNLFVSLIIPFISTSRLRKRGSRTLGFHLIYLVFSCTSSTFSLQKIQTCLNLQCFQVKLPHIENTGFYIYIYCLRFQTVIVVGILSTIISLSVTIYYFTMKVSLGQETYPIKDRQVKVSYEMIFL